MKAKSNLSLFQVSEITVSYHPKFKAYERPRISSAKSAYEILINNWNLDKIEMVEQAYILLLNQANNVIGMSEISCGGIAGTVIDPKVIFGIALKANASYVILAHNHPSGNIRPSEADKQITRKLVEVGKLLNLYVLDHLIVTRHRFFSFGDEWLM
ncbi:JAB domain-containing protein [Pedobacter nyackensis]|uniref:JAB domain-containing protein n=1 Tax=Pedobacter nyackensis TaxID=475255 RepID=UPI00292F5313|nr:JAB domain-containing protein [Pedobacter nyackensis]